jgi:hypothetical protein
VLQAHAGSWIHGCPLNCLHSRCVNRFLGTLRQPCRCRHGLGATLFKDLPSLAAAVQRAPNCGPPVILVPRSAGPAKLAAALGAAADGIGSSSGCGAVPWWRVLAGHVPGALVFYEATGEGLLTACRLWLADGRPSPARDPIAWTAALRPLQLHACGGGG